MAVPTASWSDARCPATAAGVAILLWSLACGCTERVTRFEIIDHRAEDGERRFVETFPEAYYSIDESGNLELVLRRVSIFENDPHQQITQIIHIRSIWRSMPGRTVAERTQINATVNYMILLGQAGAAFEGAGSVFFSLNKRTDELTGEVELALLKPTRQIGGGADLFSNAQLSGKFKATRDPRLVTRIINDMERTFGPPPRQP